jgi:hypothetical protein
MAFVSQLTKANHRGTETRRIKCYFDNNIKIALCLCISVVSYRSPGTDDAESSGGTEAFHELKYKKYRINNPVSLRILMMRSCRE